MVNGLEGLGWERLHPKEFFDFTAKGLRTFWMCFFQFSRLSMVNPRHFVESTNLMLFLLIEIWGSWGDVYFTFFWVDYQRVCWCIDLVSRLGVLISGVLSVHSQLTSLSNVVLLSANNPESLCWHICDVHCKACRTKNRALWHSIFHFRIVMVNWFLLAR